VYDAGIDTLREPALVDPSALAAAVRKLFAAATTYEAISRSASEHVAHAFDFESHVAQVMSVVDAVAEQGRA
jgi:glycosyltransferase involved in cell wall biosynthesis